MGAVGWVRVCGGWRRQLDEERQLQEFSRQKENNQAGEHIKAQIRHESKPEKHHEPLWMNFAGFGKLSQFNSIIGWDPVGLHISPQQGAV